MLKKIPHTYVIVFFIIIFSAVLTWIVPGGEFDRQTVVVDGLQKEIIVENSFKYIENNPQTWQIFAALFKGFEDKADIIIFILMIGGAFWIMNKSKAMDVGIFSFLNFTKKIEKNRFIKKIGVQNIILILIMLMFSAFGAIFGMSEETIAFIIILVPLAISMGYDSITGVAMVFVAAGLGFAGAILNPFTIGIAQGLSDIPIYSGINYRMFCWLIINIVGITFILRYANKIHKNPEKSLVYKEDEYWRNRGENSTNKLEYYTPKMAWITFGLTALVLIVVSIYIPMTEMHIGNKTANLPVIPISTVVFILLSVISLRKSVHFFILNVLLFTIVFLIIGVMGYQWYVMEIATLFFAMGLISGLSVNYGGNEITKHFLDGVKDILSAGLIVGLAGGIIIILKDGKIIDTILFSLAKGMNGMGKLGSIGSMYLIQNFINIIIPSGSAKAALTMPLMAPFSDIVGISRQATVVAFQFGDGFTNMITPTSGVLIGVLEVAKIPYNKWVKWIAPLIITLLILGFLLLIPTVYLDLKGF